jgi:hypothetical protein
MPPGVSEGAPTAGDKVSMAKADPQVRFLFTRRTRRDSSILNDEREIFMQETVMNGEDPCKAEQAALAEAAPQDP